MHAIQSCFTELTARTAHLGNLDASLREISRQPHQYDPVPSTANRTQGAPVEQPEGADRSV
jgi:hypothetical protein